MFGWRIRGRWTCGARSGEEDFLVVAHTREPEEARVRGMRYLVSLALVGDGSASAVDVELLEKPELLGHIADNIEMRK